MRQVDDAIDRWTGIAEIGERLYVVIERRERGFAWYSARMTRALAADPAVRQKAVDEMLEDGLAEAGER